MRSYPKTLQRYGPLPGGQNGDTMFSRELLMVRKRKPYITPVYINPQEIGLAEKIINVYTKGKTKGQIDEHTQSLETHSTFKVVRGLSELLRRRAHFESVYTVEPKKLRQYLYAKGFVTNEKERDTIVKEAAKEFGVSLLEVEDTFWKDREEFQVLVTEPDIQPEDLIKYYNLSLSQTLLFDALSLEVVVTGNYQHIFRMIKYLGLMYEITPNDNSTFTTTVTGPASLFKKTKKYGTSLAKLLPVIMKAPSWKIKGRIETTVAGEPRIYIFELSDSKKEYFPDVLVVKEQFDSAVEENFAKRFSSLRKDWDIKREPTVLQAGPSVLIPDFSLERRDKTWYIEIVGFWTPEYLEKKIKKVKNLTQEITLCVNRELKCTKRDFQTDMVNVIFYDKQVPMKPILEKVRKIEQQQLQEEKQKLANIDIELDNVVSLHDIAKKYSVGVDTIKEIFKEGDNGVIVKDTFVNNAVLQEIVKKIENLEDMRWSSVKQVLHEYGLDESVLRQLGFSIEWKTLDMKNAVVKKI
jgi:predicted nuclease of restriction endonuclease-like RecB superfamily